MEEKGTCPNGVSQWALGDEGYYVLPKSPRNGRPETMYLAVVVINVTPKRVIVRQQSGRGGHRILKAEFLVKAVPEGAWVTGRC